MPIEHHNLVDELPEFKEDIQRLKSSDTHFRKLYDEYHFLTREVEKMEKEIILTSTIEEEEFKKRRLQLKDTLFGYLRANRRETEKSSAVA